MTSIKFAGEEARDFASRHLHELLVDVLSWEVVWWRPEPFEIWLETFPHSELHGGGAAELTRIEASELARRLEAPGSREIPDVDSLVEFIAYLLSRQPAE